MRPIVKMAVQSVTTATVVLGVSLNISSAYAQTVAAELSNAAQTACKNSAVAKGFEVADVVSVEPKAGTTDGVNVVLNLTKGGQPYKLTCGYSKAEGAMIGESSAPAATTTTPATTTTTSGGFPWGWFLLPLIGLPLLAWLFKSMNRDERTTTRTVDSTRSYASREAIVRNFGNPVNVYSGPGTNYSISRTVQDGQRIALSGNTNQDWTELTDGGWVPTQNLEFSTTRSTRH